MKKKIEEVIHYSKLKQISYNSNEGGDEFRYYSKYNTSYETNSIERIPVTDFKIYQVRYPSKLTQNNDLRII